MKLTDAIARWVDAKVEAAVERNVDRVWRSVETRARRPLTGIAPGTMGDAYTTLKAVAAEARLAGVLPRDGKAEHALYLAQIHLGEAVALERQVTAAWAAHTENGALRAALELNALRHAEALERLAQVEPDEQSRAAYAKGAETLRAQLTSWSKPSNAHRWNPHSPGAVLPPRGHRVRPAPPWLRAGHCA